jgi:hypothetical protein
MELKKVKFTGIEAIPFPVLVDQPNSEYSVRMLTNPDFGKAIVLAALGPRESALPGLISGADPAIGTPLSHRDGKANRR